MKLKSGHHLAYCTNVHRGESWNQTLESLQDFTLDVKSKVQQSYPEATSRFAIGLRLSSEAAEELQKPHQLNAFRSWLEDHNCYLFTINGFPYGQFHGVRVKEQVYAPDWTQTSRLHYTQTLFQILNSLAPVDIPISVSTLPGSFKEFIHSKDQEDLIFKHIWDLVDFLEKMQQESGRSDLTLGLEPEPLGWFENTEETIRFFDRLQSFRPGDDRWKAFIGVNYDTCHFAVEYEDAFQSLTRFHALGIRISKIHLSSAFRLKPSPETLAWLKDFSEDTYLHQVIAKDSHGQLTRFKDLPMALDAKDATAAEEWRVHFHIPLHSPGREGLLPTSDHTLETLDFIKANPGICKHLEMETYTWEVMPDALKSSTVTEQLAKEYEWTLAELGKRGLN